LRAVNSLQL